MAEAQTMTKALPRCRRRNSKPARAPRAIWPGGADKSRVRPKARPASAMLYRSEEHTSELQSLMRISYAVFCLKKKKRYKEKQKEQSIKDREQTTMKEYTQE